jgi:hypothetical protein
MAFSTQQTNQLNAIYQSIRDHQLIMSGLKPAINLDEANRRLRVATARLHHYHEAIGAMFNIFHAVGFNTGPTLSEQGLSRVRMQANVSKNSSASRIQARQQNILKRKAACDAILVQCVALRHKYREEQADIWVYEKEFAEKDEAKKIDRITKERKADSLRAQAQRLQEEKKFMQYQEIAEFSHLPPPQRIAPPIIPPPVYHHQGFAIAQNVPPSPAHDLPFSPAHGVPRTPAPRPEVKSPILDTPIHNPFSPFPGPDIADHASEDLDASADYDALELDEQPNAEDQQFIDDYTICDNCDLPYSDCKCR